jgi:drug/metabolite transporter (DMT)-like permease
VSRARKGGLKTRLIPFGSVRPGFGYDRRIVSNLAFMYALLAGLSMTVLAVGLKLAAPGIHPALGTAIVTGTAFLVNVLVALAIRATGAPVPFSLESLYVLVIVGVATAGVNLFTLFAYASGLRITSSFIIGGTSTVLLLVVGFVFLKEPFTWTKLFAIGLVGVGIFLLQRTDI